MSREYTCKAIELAEGGVVSWETIARACMSYMSEDEVEDMMRVNELVEETEEEGEDE